MASAPTVKRPTLCLDLAGITGWAFDDASGTPPVFGCWHLNTSSKLLGPRFVSYENELIAALDRFGPRRVCMEAPLPASRQGNTLVARQQFGLAAYTEGECHRARVQCMEQDAGEVRKAVLGRGSFGGSDAGKAAVMAWCAAQGYAAPDHNAGDALVLLRFCAMKDAGLLP